MASKILKHEETFEIHGEGILTATLVGTRKYSDEEICIVERGGETLRFNLGLPPGKLSPMERRLRVEAAGVKLDTDRIIFQGRELLDPGVVHKVIENHNLITTVGKGLLADMMIDKAGYDTGLTVQAEGTGVAAPALGDTTLTTEAARLVCTSRSRLLNVATYSTFFTAAQANDNIKEAGILGHDAEADGDPAGILFSHWLVSFDNSGALYDLTFSYVLTIG